MCPFFVSYFLFRGFYHIFVIRCSRIIQLIGRLEVYFKTRNKNVSSYLICSGRNYIHHLSFCLVTKDNKTHPRKELIMAMCFPCFVSSICGIYSLIKTLVALTYIYIYMTCDQLKELQLDSKVTTTTVKNKRFLK